MMLIMQNTNENVDQLFPWLGLLSYSEQHSESFWGKSVEAEQLFYEIYDNSATIVYGPSGVGKSSLLRAGVFPKLRTKQFFPIYVRLTHNKNNCPYMEQIISAIKAECEKSFCSVEEIAPLPADAKENLWTWFHRHKFSDVLDVQIRPVLVFDQFEEIFTISEKDKSEIQDIITQICDIAGDHLPADLERVLNENNLPLPFPATAEYRVVLSLRNDFVSHIDEISHKCPVLRNNRISVKPMKVKNAREVVYNEKTKNIVSQVVAEKIIQAVSEHSLKDNKPDCFIEPALLSLFCEQINLCRIKYGLSEITEELVEENKGNILANFYDTAMHKISVSACEKLEDNLISDSGFRLLKAVDDLLQLGIEDSEIKELVNARLLRSDVRNGVHYVELCHDIMLPVIAQRRNMRVLNKRMKLYRKWSFIAISFIIFVCLILQTGYYLFFKEYKNYYKNMAKIYGVPTGINQLTEEQVKHRLFSYEFRTKGLYDFKFNCWKNFKWNYISTYIPFEPALPYRVTIVNNQMQPTSHYGHFWRTYLWEPNDSSAHKLDESNNNQFDRSYEDMTSVVIVDFLYDDYRRPRAEIGKNSKGQTIWTCLYVKHFSPDSDQANEISDGGVQANVVPVDALVSFVDKNGYPVRLRSDSKGDPAIIYIGINYSHEANSLGYEKEWIWINPQKRDYALGLDNAHKRMFTYDQSCYETGSFKTMSSHKYNYETKSFDPILDAAGNHGWEQTFDSNGNISTVRFFDTSGNTMQLDGRGFVTYGYDSYGNEVYECYWKDETKKQQATDKNGIHRVEYNIRKGQQTGRTIYSADNRTLWVGKNVFSVVQKINELGLVTEEKYFSKSNDKACSSTGVHHTRYSFDNNGRLNEQQILDAKGNYTVDENGLCRCVLEYYGNSKSVRKRISYSLTNHGIWGDKNVMRVERVYNRHGQEIEVSYYKHSNGNELIAYRAEKNNKDNTVARIIYVYDEKGLRVGEEYRDVSNKPTVNTDNISSYKYIFDPQTRKLKKDILYSLPGYGVWGHKNVMRVEREYDINGNITGVTYFAALTGEELAGDNRNICYQKSYFDDKNQLICREHFALRGKTILNLPTSKATMWRSSYSYEGGKKIQTEKWFSNAYHDESYWTKYQPEGFGDGVFSGIAEIKTYQFKENGVTTSVDRIVKLTARNAEGDIVPFDGNVAIRICDFNTLGNQTYYENRNSKNELTPDPKGITHCITEYDSSGKTKKREILYGNNLEGKKGVAKIHREYNSQGKLTEEKYFDKNDKEAALPNGMVRGTISYDESGKNIKMVTIYGQASIPGTKVARFIRKLNFASQPFEERYYDAQGNPANNIRGIYAISISYDASGKKKLKEIFYGKDIDGRKNITRIEKTFDLNGKILSEKFF